MSLSVEQFVEKLDAIGLLSSDEISQVTDNLPADRRPADVPSLAKLLVREGKLTKYQATAVYQDKSKHLVMGPYVVIDRIGAGGMGQVLKAVHKTMDREVALKILPSAKVDSPSAIKRFHQEVRAAARLLHPNIVAAHDAGEFEGMHYLVMEYVEGADLSAVVREQGQLPVELAVDYMVQAAQGLGFAHEKGIVHRDIKPGNLLLSNDGVVKILDMGLARLTGGDLNKLDDGEGEGLTQSGQIMGTVDYMAPEQALDTRRADHRADIYALGCTLYRLLTGDVPFAGDTMMMKLLAHREEPIPSLREHRPDVSPALEAVYQRMMAKEPDQRQQSMAEVVEQLQAALAGPVAPPPARPAAAPAPPRERDQPSADSALSAFLQNASQPAATTAKKQRSTSAFEETIERSSSDEGTGDRLEEVEALEDVGWAPPTGQPDSHSRPMVGNAHPTRKPWLIPAIAGGGLVALLLIAIVFYALLSTTDDVRLADDAQPTSTSDPLGDNAIPTPQSNDDNPARPSQPSSTNDSTTGTTTQALPPPDYGPGAPPLARAPFTKDQAKEHQEKWAEFLDLPVENEVELPGGVKMAFRLIPPGEFIMGSTPEEQAKFLEEAKADNDTWAIDRILSEGPQHRVRITKPFYLGEYEVTQAQWQSVMGTNPSNFKDNATHPVEMVRWDDIQPFLAKLNESAFSEKMTFVLPKEAQWEYACRAGTTTPYCGGESPEDLGQYGWFNANSGGKTHPVGELKPNAFGLYDMHGNVWEWCADWYAADYYAKAPVDDPTGPSAGSSRVLRGGSWRGDPRHCRSAYRSDHAPGHRYDNLGFRLAMTIPDSVWRGKAPAASGSYALQFTKDQYIEFEDESFGYDGTHPLTLESWIKPEGTFPRSGGQVALFGPGSILALQIHPIGGTPSWHFYATNGIGPSGTLPTEARGADLDSSRPEFSHVAMVYDGEEVAFFLDGIRRQQSISYKFRRKIGRPHPYTIGALWRQYPDSVAPLDLDYRVTFDEIRISSIARYKADFTPKRRFETDNETIALYHIDEGNGTQLRDSSGNGHHGVIRGGVWVKRTDGSPGGEVVAEGGADNGWLALNKLFDPDQDAKTGEWKKSGDGSISGVDPTDGAKTGTMLFPVELNGSYQLEFGFRRPAGDNSLNVHLPLGDTSVTFMLSGFPNFEPPLTGLQLLDGKPLPQGDATINDVEIEQGRHYRFAVSVQHSGDNSQIEVTLDDKPIFSWNGARSRLRPAGIYELEDTQRVGFGIINSAFVYDDIRVRMTEGQWRLLRPEEAPAPAQPNSPTDSPRHIVAADGWVDILPMADTSRDVVDGDWKPGGDALEVTGTDDTYARLMLPVVPKGSYAVELDFTRTKGAEDIAVLLPVADRSVVFFTSAFGRWSGINVIGGAKVHEPSNPTRQPTAVVTGTPIKVQVAVMLLDETNVRFVIQAGDTDRVDVTVPIADLDKGAKWKWHDGVTDTSRLGLGVEEVEAMIDSIKLKALPGGEAEILDSDRESVGIEQARPTESQPSEPDDDQRWITLFNGRDLTGWQAIGDAKLWGVSRGTLVTNGAGVGWLSTDKEFSNFVLQFEFQLPANGNSGVFLRVPRAGAINGGEFLEIALQDDTAPRATKNFTGSAYNIAERKVAGAMHPVGSGKWNLMEIRAVGRAIQVALNGELVNEFDLGSVQIPAPMAANAVRQSGYIGLQCNRTGAAFRNIRIRPVE